MELTQFLLRSSLLCCWSWQQSVTQCTRIWLVYSCGRSVFCQKARLLGWRRRREWLPWRCPHGRSSGQSTGRREKSKVKGRHTERVRTKKQRRTNAQPLIMDGMRMGWRAHADTWAMWCDSHNQTRAMCMRKMTCEVYQSTPHAGHNGSTSTVNETNCNKKHLHFLWAHQLQSDVSHHESLEEECHLLYCAGDIGPAISSPDSRWRRSLRELVSEKSIVNTCEMFTLRVNSFAVSHPRIPGCVVLYLFFGFAMWTTMATPFLDHVVRDRESIQS